MDQLTGRADIYVDGAYVETSQEGATLSSVAGIENTVVMDSRGKAAGYTTKAVPSVIKANFLHTPDFVIDLFTLTTLTVMFVCDNGPVYLMASAVFTKDEGLDSNKGTIPISFSGVATRV